MNELPTNVELLTAAYLFEQSPDAGRARLETAVGHDVNGPLYEQLRLACRRALAAPRTDVKLACAALGDLISAIGRDVLPARRESVAHRPAPAHRSAVGPRREPPQARLPYRDDDDSESAWPGN